MEKSTWFYIYLCNSNYICLSQVKIKQLLCGSVSRGPFSLWYYQTLSNSHPPYKGVHLGSWQSNDTSPWGPRYFCLVPTLVLELHNSCHLMGDQYTLVGRMNKWMPGNTWEVSRLWINWTVGTFSQSAIHSTLVIGACHQKREKGWNYPA